MRPTSNVSTQPNNFPASVRDRTIAIIKTGITIAGDRIPIQFTYKRPEIPQRIVYGDGSYKIGDIEILDAYVDVSEEIREQDAFKMYDVVQEALKRNSIPQGTWVDFWSLARYLDLHANSQVFRNYPDKDWYVTQDDDAYILWPTLLRLLAELDPNEELWLGKHDVGINTTFANGGGCYVMSSRLMHIVFASRPDYANESPELYEILPYGDGRIGKALISHPDTKIKEVTHGGRNMLVWRNRTLTDEADTPRLNRFYTAPPELNSYSAKSWYEPVISFGHLKGVQFAQIAKAEELIARQLGRPDDARVCDFYCE